ncbi:hypothetical protein F0P96_19680 [Hymenobacter busanensis]|uniref:Uncharacterized protein n=1 Tax=Hymenobacter busanensis TaxID=2607656 RepID=A0A7L4ZY60_9BACT|nr:gliding motility-associated C-terminal domain-containing protein [Hymenobacter busanensis]KAA9325552.1 hypothetical protein F0P96_19680 [Hymenobacter busanensis]QHJ07776.1 hypothetical protein GUY19_10985 [Hymenobacter busanensis]
MCPRILTPIVAFYSLLISVFASAQAPAPAPARGLEFIENRGQWAAPVRYMAGIPNGRLFMERTGFTYALSEPVDPHAHGRESLPHPDKLLKAHAVQVRFVGATATEPKAQLPTAEVRNYLLGNDPAHWARQVASYAELRYANLWPGIEARFYENATAQLEYDFELASGANAAAIRLAYTGADALRLTPEGALTIGTSVGQVTELAPKAWQVAPDGRRQPVSCRYVLRGQGVSFALGDYDRRRPLTIDPTVVFSSFTGSTADNWGFTATYDAQGNMYSGGIVFGLGYPASPGAYSQSFSGGIDVAIIKYNPATTGPASRVWATYLGGNGADFPESMVVNSQGELVVLGATSSTLFPTTTNAYDRSFNGGTYVDPFNDGPPYDVPGGSDLFIARLNATGSSLVASTFLGGTSNDGILNPSGGTGTLVHNYGDAFRGDVLVDAADNVYIASSTASLNFPGINGFRTTFNGGASDAVVCKLTPDLNTLLWSNFLGGGGADAAYSLQLDATGNVFVSGGTTSINFPTTAGALYSIVRGGVDGFVARLNNAGNVLQRATYLGTASYDQAYFVQLDTNGNPYVLGQSLGAYPVTPGRYANANSHQFIQKLNSDLTTSVFSTVFGSGRFNIDISPTAFLVDQCDRIYVSGWGGILNSAFNGNNNGYTTGMPTTPNGIQRTTDGSDFYFLQLAPNAAALDYATFFGANDLSIGDHVDGGTSRFDPRGIVYQAVCSCGSGSFPIPPGAGSYSTTIGSSAFCNNVAFKFNFESNIPSAGVDQTVCATAAPIPLGGSPAGGIWSGPGVTGSAGSYTFTPSTALLGVQTLTYTVLTTGSCSGVATLRLTVTAPSSVSFNALPQPAYCLGAAPLPPVPLVATPAGGTFSGPGVSGTQFLPSAAGAGTHTITYTYSLGGCTVQATRPVTVVSAAAGPNFSTCAPAPPIRLGGLPAGGIWSGPGVVDSVGVGFFFVPKAALAGQQTLRYTVSASGGTCSASSTLVVGVTAVPVVSLTPLPDACTNATSAIRLAASPAGGTWSGPGITGTVGSGFFFSPGTAGAGTHRLTYSVGTAGPCPALSSQTITVTTPPTLAVAPDTVLCPGTMQAIRLKASPSGGAWSGPNVTAAGVFTPPAGFSGSATLTYTITQAPCTVSATRRISVAPVPAFAPAWAPTACPETHDAPLQVRFSATSAIQWDFGDGSQATGTEVLHTYITAGSYHPSATLLYNNSRCQLTQELPVIEVKDVFLPNIITPNGDQKNDVFRPSFGCQTRLQVFSRWGNEVFEATNYQNDWGGGTLPGGIYYYLLQSADGRKAKGWLEIQR